ncbi:MAG: hypothetical protein C4539_05370 [Ignavibacteriales bacterium]|nr:MAG: hypothetical protein C4539_05370 [Ignavibacteriales bacterium]
MIRKIFLKLICFLTPLVFIGLFSSCDTGVEDSPAPGIVRVVLRANPSDTYIINRSDTFYIFSPYYNKTRFNLNIFQGRIYSGDKFAILYKTTQSYQQEDSIYNMVQTNYTSEQINSIVMDLFNGKVKLADLVCDYKSHKIFESYAPPGNYTRLTFGVNASQDVFKSRMAAYNVYGDSIVIPLEVPEDEELLKNLDVDFKVNEGGITQLNVEVDVFKSVYRYRDAYRLNRNLRVLSVEYF